MKLIILTQYFPPEIGAPQNRLFELAVRLKDRGYDIEVLTAMPNYPQMKKYKGYRFALYKKEMMEGIKVHRVWLFTSSSKNIFLRLLNYFSFVFSSLFAGLFVLRRSHFLMVESPPLFLGISAWFLSRFKKAKLIFNVSDLWPESAEKLGIVNNKTFLGLAYSLEKFCYNKSALITGQTQGICADINKRMPHKKTYWLPNGADISYFTPKQSEGLWRSKHGIDNDDFVLLYAGILGYAQGLDIIVKAAAELHINKSLKFVLLGSGPEKERLVKLAETMGTDNVLFMQALPKADMPQVLSEIDVALVPLRKLPLFMGAIPSKIFEALAMEKPVILSVDGEARHLFIDTAEAGLYIEPENHNALANAVLHFYNNRNEVLQKGKNGRKYVAEFFNRDIIAEKLAEELKEL